MNNNHTPFPDEIWTSYLLRLISPFDSRALSLVDKGLHALVRTHWGHYFKRRYGDKLSSEIDTRFPDLSWQTLIYNMNHKPSKIWKWEAVTDDSSSDPPSFSRKEIDFINCPRKRKKITAYCRWGELRLIGLKNGQIYLINSANRQRKICNLWKDTTFKQLATRSVRSLTMASTSMRDDHQAVKWLSPEDSFSFSAKIGDRPPLRITLDPGS